MTTRYRLNARDWVNSESGKPITLPLVPMGGSNDSDVSGRPAAALKRADSQASVSIILSKSICVANV